MERGDVRGGIRQGQERVHVAAGHECVVDADVFYDFFLSFDFANRTHDGEPGSAVKITTGDRLCQPCRFLYVLVVHIAGAGGREGRERALLSLPRRRGKACGF